MRKPPEIGPIPLLALFLVLLSLDGGYLGSELDHVNQAILGYLQDVLEIAITSQNGPR